MKQADLLRRSFYALRIFLCTVGLLWPQSAHAAGLTVITHGLQLDENYPAWVDKMAEAIRDSAYDSGQTVTWYHLTIGPRGAWNPVPVGVSFVNKTTGSTQGAEVILTVDWSRVSAHTSANAGGPLPLPGVGTTTAEVAQVIVPAILGTLPSVGLDHPLAELPIHLIGHSRGGSVMVELARLLGEKGIWVDHLTTIDPHPLKTPDFGVVVTPPFRPADPPIVLHENVVFADNYWRRDPSWISWDPLHWGDFNGKEVEQAYNLQLNEIALGPGLLDQFNQHSKAHDWYHGTINPDYAVGLDSWYLRDQNLNPLSRYGTGFRYSRLGRGAWRERPDSGVSWAHGGHGSREASDRQNLQWPNVSKVKSSNNDSWAFTAGEDLRITYLYQSHDQAATVEFFLDPDENPYGGGAIQPLGGPPALGANGGNVTAAAYTARTSGISKGTYHLGAKITANGFTRYDYDPTLYLVSSAGPPPVVRPSAPSTLAAVAVSSSRIDVSWKDVASETGFRIERRLADSGDWAALKTLPANVTAYSDTGLAADTAYSYRVRAFNSAGDSPGYSPPASDRTLPAAGTNYTLSIQSSGSASGVKVSSYVGMTQFAFNLTPAIRSFTAGSVVGVACPQTLAGGQVFQKWVREDSVVLGLSTVIDVKMNSPHTITAVYGSATLLAKTLSSITPEGPSSVDERSATLYKALATYTDGSSSYVNATWSDDSSYASMSPAGLLNTDAVTSDKVVQIEARFTSGGVTMSRTKNVTVRNVDAVPTYTLSLAASHGYISPQPQMNSYPSGTSVRLTATPDDGYVFDRWSGNASGADRTVYVTMNSNRSVTANFVLDSSVGNINVTLLPALAAAEGAAWTYHNFTDWRASGAVMTGLTPRTGKYLYFRDIPGWITPDSVKADIIGGQTTQVSATYREILGSVQVTLTPEQAIAAGARWRLDGGAWMESGVTVADVSTGNHTIQFLAPSGWAAPPSQTVPVARGITSTRSGDYGPPAGFPIITAVSPRTGPIAGGTTVTIDGANFLSGATASFGGVASASVTVVSSTRITAVTPARASYGSVALSLTSGGQTVTQGNGFSYLNALGSNIELVGQIGGNVQAVAVVGSMVYYSEGTGLVVSDFANPSAPVERGRIALPAVIKDVVVVNNVAFVAVGAAGLYVLDVSTATAPAIVGFFDTEGDASAVAVLGARAYVADGFSGLQVLDVSNPSAVARLGLLDTAGRVDKVSVGIIGSRVVAFVAEGDLALRAIDATTPSAPVEMTSVAAQSGAGIMDVKIVGTTLYVSDWQAGVKIFNASNPTTLVQTGSRDNVGPSVIDVVGGRLYTCGSGLKVANLSVTPVPTSLGYFDPGSFCYKLVVANNLAFAAMGSDGLKVVVVSNPASMSLASSIQALGGVEDVWVSGNVAFVGNASGLHTVDVSNLARPARSASLPGARVTDIAVANGRATLVNYGSEVVRIVNVANPSSLSLLGTYTNVEAWNVALMGTTPVLAAATRDAAHQPKLDVLNISSPSTPQSAGSLLLDTAGGIADAVAVVGSWAFIGRPNAALDVVSLANPASPQKVGSVPMANFFMDVAASEDGNFVYVADAALGIQVVDVTTKSAPAIVRIVDPVQTPGMGARAVRVSGNRLVATEQGFLFVFDISAPAAPQLLGYYDIPGSGDGIAVVGDVIFVTGYNAGVSILRLGDVGRPTVAITSPTTNSAHSTIFSSVQLGGSASDDKGVVRVSWENGRGGGGVATGTTSWQIAGIQLASGLNVITVTAEDGNGNLATDSLAVTANLPDATPPVVIISGPRPDPEFVVRADVITLSGSAVDNQSVTALNWSNDRGGSGALSLSGQNWSVPGVSLLPGPNPVHVTASDASGNTASATAVIFYVPPDTSAPAVSIEFPTLNATYETESSTLNLSGMANDDSGVSRVEWSSDRGGRGAASGVAPWSVNDIPLKPGLNVIEVLVTDGAGNSSSDSLSVIFTPIAATSVLSIGNVRVSEGNFGSKAMTFTVVLAPPSASTVTVDYRTQDGTATAGADYFGMSGTLTFAPSETTKTLVVTVLGDTVAESNESLALVLSAPVNATLATTRGQGVISNDDASSAPTRDQPSWQEFFAVDTLETPYVGDFNGDRKADIITFTRQNPNAIGDVYVALSDGVKFGDNTKWHDFFAISTAESVVIGDYNGDGRDDIGTWLGKASRQVYVALSTGSGMLGETVWASSIGTDPTDLVIAGDANGDGKDDLIAFARKEGKVYVALSEGTKFGAPTVWHNFFAVSTYERPRVADVNGDGKADIVTFATDSPTAFGDVYVATSNGAQFVSLAGNANDSSKWHDFFAIRPTEEIRIGDLNGDGKDDFFTFLPPPFAQCYSVLSQGTSMADNVEWAEKVAPLLGVGDNVYVGDVNGDGKADIIIFAQKEGKVFVSLAP